MAKEGVFINAPSPILVPGDWYILAILNSKIADWYIAQQSVARNGGYYEYKPMYVQTVPIPKPNPQQKSELEKLSLQLHNIKLANQDTTDIELQIATLVYNIYGLTPEEISFLN